MAFQLVYYSQQDPKWKEDLLGFGDPGDTIGYVGCALTSVTMLLNGHGMAETPKSLNEKLKKVDGFVSAAIRWGAVSQIYPQVSLKAFIPCTTTDAPLSQIDASLAAGQPAIVMVDSSPASGLQTHWVVLYARKGDDYLMLDPWPYQTDVKKETYLMPRYSQGRTLKNAIQHVILYEYFGASGGISTPSSSSTNTTPAPSTAPAPVPSGGPYARVKAEVTWGLNMRSSTDTSSMANVVVVVPAGSLLTIVEKDGEAKIGAVNQWIRVRDVQGHEGFAAAWYLEKVQTSSPAPTTPTTTPSQPSAPVVSQPSSPTPSSTTPKPATNTTTTTASTSSPQPATPPVTEPVETKDMRVKVSSAVGTSGLRLRKTASMSGTLVAVIPAGTILTVLDKPSKTRLKLGKAGQWILVRDSLKQRGYISAEFVSEV